VQGGPSGGDSLQHAREKKLTAIQLLILITVLWISYYHNISSVRDHKARMSCVRNSAIG
jgi:hypothetical protein